MDVILLKAIDRLGDEGSVVRVKPGFARNYLIPKGLAAPASAQQLNAMEVLKRQRARKLERARAEWESLRRKLEGRSLTLTLNLGADGKAFGSVTAHDIIEALAREGLRVERHAVELEHPIKTLGVYDVPIRLHPDVIALLKVWVVKA